MNAQNDGGRAAIEGSGDRQRAALRWRFDPDVDLQPGVMLGLVPALGSTAVSMEIVGQAGEVMMLVVADAHDRGRLSGLLESALPGSGTAAEDLPLASAPFLGWQLASRLVDSLPLQATSDDRFDLPASLAHLMAAQEEGYAIFQVILQPFRADAWRTRAVRDAHRLTVVVPSMGERLVGLAAGKHSHRTTAHSPRWLRSFQEATYEKSASQGLVRATIRFVARGAGRDATADLAKQALNLVCASFTNGANTLDPLRLGSQDVFAHEFNERLPGRGIVVTPAEVAVLWHPPPRTSCGVPGLWVLGRRVRSPREAREGDLRIGRDIQGHNIFVRQPDRLTHAAFLGATGGGKTTLMLNVALEDAERGDGFVWLDPKGGAIAQLLSRMPAARRGDLLLLDPASEDGISFNPLDRGPGVSAHQVADEVVASLQRLFGDAWGPRLERVLRMALVAVVLGRDEPNLMDLHRFLTQPAFRGETLQDVDDDFTLSFWRDEFDALSPSVRRQWTEPVHNRLAPFFGNPLVRRVIGQGHGVDLGAVLRDRKILLADFAQGKIGEENGRVLSNLLMAGTYRAAMGRVGAREEPSRDFTLFVDEAHSAAPINLVQMLSQARAGHLRVCLCTQFLHQLPSEVVESVLANVSFLAAFRLGERDARLLEDRFRPEFSVADLVKTDNHVAAVRLVSGGQVLPSFSLLTDPLPPSKGEVWARQMRDAAVGRQDRKLETPKSQPRAMRSISELVEVEWDEA